jgi:hypothetical protein
MEKHTEITIGLFGTCDKIRWRDPFMSKYDKLGIAYFNPMVDDWHPGLVDLENYYLRNAEIILFPVLKESLGTGSLAEIGFSINYVLRQITQGSSQFLVVIIDDDCIDERKTEEERKRSVKDRALIKSKVKKMISYPNIVLVESLDEMFEMSLELYELAKKAVKYNDRYTEVKTA